MLGRLSFLGSLHGYQLVLGAVVSPGDAIQETLPDIGSTFGQCVYIRILHSVHFKYCHFALYLYCFHQDI